MIVHGTKDKIVDMEYSKRAYELYLENKGKKDEPRVVSFLPIEEGRAGRYINKSSKIKCLRLEGSNFRLGGIAPITRAVPSFLALNERIFLMRLAVSVAWQKGN